MYTKKYEKDGENIVEFYRSWYDELWDGWIYSFWSIVIGLMSFVCTPFIALYSIWNPRCVGGEYEVGTTTNKNKK